MSKELSRRDFLRLTGAAAGSAVLGAACESLGLEEQRVLAEEESVGPTEPYQVAIEVGVQEPRAESFRIESLNPHTEWFVIEDPETGDLMRQTEGVVDVRRDVSGHIADVHWEDRWVQALVLQRGGKPLGKDSFKREEPSDERINTTVFFTGRNRELHDSPYYDAGSGKTFIPKVFEVLLPLDSYGENFRPYLLHYTAVPKNGEGKDLFYLKGFKTTSISSEELEAIVVQNPGMEAKADIRFAYSFFEHDNPEVRRRLDYALTFLNRVSSQTVVLNDCAKEVFKVTGIEGLSIEEQQRRVDALPCNFPPRNSILGDLAWLTN